MVRKGDGRVCASEGMSYEVMVKGGKVMMEWFVKVKGWCEGDWGMCEGEGIVCEDEGMLCKGDVMGVMVM